MVSSAAGSIEKFNDTISDRFGNKPVSNSTTSGLPYASSLEEPYVLQRDIKEMIQSGLSAIDRRVEAKEDDLKNKGITDPEALNAMLQQFRDECEIEFYNDVYGDVSVKCSECLKKLSQHFKKSNWDRMDSLEREDALNTLALSAGKAFRFDVRGVRFYNGNPNSRGYYSGDGYLYLNSDVLSDSNNRLDAIDTVFHEGRHAFQHAAANNPNMYSIDRITASQWKNNFYPNYIRYEQNPMRYFSQPIEVDARTFAETVIKNGGIV